MVLVVFCHIRRRNQDGCPSRSLQLGEGGGSRPADDQVRSRQTIVHIVYVFSDVYIWIFLEDSAALCKHLRKILHSILSGRVDVMDLAGAGSAFFGVPCNQICHRLIEPVCTLTAAEGNDAHFIPNSQLFPCLLAVGIDNRLPNRIADHQLLAVGGQIFLCFRHRQQNLIDIAGKQLCGHTGKGVGFVRCGANPHLRRLSQNRTADIPARSDHQIRSKALNQLFGAR